MCSSNNVNGNNQEDHTPIEMDQEPPPEGNEQGKTVKLGAYGEKNDVTIFFCHNCSYKTTLKNSLRVHVRVHTKPNSNLEKISGPPSVYGYQYNAYSSNCIVEKRRQMGESIKREQCRFCQYVNDSNKLARHVTARHGELLRGMMQIDRNIPFSCYHCGFSTLKYKAMKTHIKVHLGLKPMKTVKILNGRRWYCCALCDYKTWRMGCYKRHMLESNKHGAKKNFQCAHCGFKAARLPPLRYHMKIHFKREGATCDLCGSVLCDQSELKSHKKRLHSDKQTFTCDTCAFSTKTDGRLKNHMLTADCSLRPFSCTQCTYKAKTMSNLQYHMVIHSDERPFVCEQCDQRFKRMFVLKSHIKMKHSNDKPFKCPYCDYRCTFRGNLSQHLRTHSEERPFKCPFCTHTAKSRVHIRSHEQEVHFQVKPFKCPYCTYRATRKNLIKLHKKKFHAC